MKFKMIIFVCILPFCLRAQGTEHSSMRGNAGFDELKGLDYFGSVTEIHLDKNVFNMIDYENTEDGVELRKLLKPLKAITILTIDNIDSLKADSLNSTFIEIGSLLLKDGWKKFFTKSEGNSYTRIYIRYSLGEKVSGLAITVLEQDGSVYKASLINITGSINMSSIGKIGRKFSLPALSDTLNDE